MFEDSYLLFVKLMDAHSIDYMLTGSTACIIYSEPRLTNDVDIVIDCKVKDILKITQAFQNDNFYCPPIETLKIEASRANRGHFNIIVSPTNKLRKK